MELGQLVVPKQVVLASWEKVCPFNLRRLIKPWKTNTKALVRKVLQTIPFMDVAAEVGWLMLGSQLLSFTAVPLEVHLEAGLSEELG